MWPVDCRECAVIWVVTDTTIPAGHSESVECTVGTKKTGDNLLLKPGLNIGAGSKKTLSKSPLCVIAVPVSVVLPKELVSGDDREPIPCYFSSMEVLC